MQMPQQSQTEVAAFVDKRPKYKIPLVILNDYQSSFYNSLHSPLIIAYEAAFSF